MRDILSQNRVNQQRYRAKVKKELFELLGNKCANPFNLPHPDWCNDLRCLQIDHVNGGGCKELREIRKHGNTYYASVLRKVKAGSKDYQLLCANCNWLKRFREKEAIKRYTDRLLETITERIEVIARDEKGKVIATRGKFS